MPSSPQHKNEANKSHPKYAEAKGGLGSSHQANLATAYPKPDDLTDDGQKEVYQAVLKEDQDSTDFGTVSMVYDHADLPKMKVTYNAETGAASAWDTDVELATPGSADKGLPATPFTPDLCVDSTGVHPGEVHDFKPSGWSSSEDDSDLISAGSGVTGLGVMLDPSVARQRIADNAYIGELVMGRSGAIPEGTE